MINKNNTIFEEEAVEPSDTNALFVSLYLVVLAFFILLSTISEKDLEKTKQAMSSLTDVFASELGKVIVPPISPGVHSFASVVTIYFDEVEELLKNNFQMEKIKVLRKGSKMQITIPAELLFREGKIALKRGKRNFIKNLSGILNQELNHTVSNLSINVGSRALSGLKQRENYSMDVKRAGFFVKELIKNGSAERSIIAGVAPDAQRNIVIGIVLFENGEGEIN